MKLRPVGNVNSKTTPTNRREHNISGGITSATHLPGGGLSNRDPSSSDEQAPDGETAPFLTDALALAREQITQSTLNTLRGTKTSDQRGESTWFSCFPDRLSNSKGDEREDSDRSCTCTIQ
jgi:hypothetical protein